MGCSGMFQGHLTLDHNIRSNIASVGAIGKFTAYVLSGNHALAKFDLDICEQVRFTR
jgi:hypothetical protein